MLVKEPKKPINSFNYRKILFAILLLLFLVRLTDTTTTRLCQIGDFCALSKLPCKLIKSGNKCNPIVGLTQTIESLYCDQKTK